MMGGVDMDTIEAARALESQGLLAKLPSRLHHNAFVVRDHEVNRRFFEDLLGIPLVATGAKRITAPRCGGKSSSATPSTAWPTAVRSPSSSSPTPSCTR